MGEAHLYLVALALLCLNGNAIRSGAPNVVSKLLNAVDIEFEMAAAFNVHHVFSRLLRSKSRLILGRETFQVNTGSKVVHASRGHCHRIEVALNSHSFALHAGVIPERAFQALAAIGTTLCA